ncbi:MAG: nicotinate-nucleotide--dimethylbenzimidazole phosphoribosyltransferase, partial [Desulfovibrionaceae bacterium]|nr:nicotinate-nucleotide--dimethylbenzimidazole phosphoribosyltransferase [Desulfovibrionaceae bacterium]
AATKHLDNLTKPIGSLGRLEDLAKHIYAIAAGKTPLAVTPALIYTVAADHGVARQGVSRYPQEVTRQMVNNFLRGGGGINVLSRECGLTLCLVDAGCVGGEFAAHPLLVSRRLGEGTKDLSTGQAMNRAQVLQGLRYGVQLARDAAFDGCQCIAIGEMGIGNTTSATALFAAYLDFAPALITGPGTGLNKEQLLHKIFVIEQALKLHAEILQEGDCLDVLAALGGFEIVEMCGIVLGAAAEGLPVLIDGFIATSAYVAACVIAPTVRDYAILTHVSAEPGYAKIVSFLGEEPLLHLGLRLGEGTGAALAYPLVRCAAALFNDLATFAQAGVEPVAVP